MPGREGVREDADVETASEGYARRFAGPVGAFFLEVQARTARDLLRPWPGSPVLDVGGGHAQLVGPLLEAGHAVTVYGSDPACGERLRPWTDRGRAAFRAGDLLHAPWPDRAFEVVLAFRLLPHVARWRELIAELSRLARSAVVVDYPTRRSVNALSGALFGLKKGVEGNTRPFLVFRDAEIVRAFATAGLAATARRPQFLLPMALHRAAGSAVLARALEGAAGALGLTRALGSPVVLRLERREEAK
ncbi:MAG TPA: methyltransferase domain-containing protein [Vicinamibacteria bacterium]|nr:methyltransferase domain-containing protein [Vicinamibacteria bacterium]